MVSMKEMKAQLETELGAKQGSHYDRVWLKKTVEDVIANMISEVPEEAEVSPEERGGRGRGGRGRGRRRGRSLG